MDMNLWIIGIKVIIKNIVYLVITVYHSPNSNHSEFINKMENIVVEYYSFMGTIIIIGDFNINMAVNSFYKDKLCQSIDRLGLHQIMNSFTRVTNSSSSMIDLLITNKKDLQFKIHLTPRISDHSIISINIEQNKPHIVQQKIINDYKNFNETEFQFDLMDAEWLGNCTSINNIADNFTKQIKTILQKHAPCKIISIKSTFALKAWWSEEIKNKIYERDCLYKRAVITKEFDDWNNYKKKRNEVVSEIRQQKKLYYKNEIDDCRGDAKVMWKTLKELIKGKEINKKDEISFGDKTVTGDYQICEAFNEYFLESIKEITGDIINKNGNEHILNNIVVNDVSWQNFRILSMSDLRKILKQMPNKNSNVDGITTKILKTAFEAIGNIMLHIINTSLQEGEVPINWKISTIIPIEKKENTILCSEFRPINMLPPYEKLLELTVKDQLLEYLEVNEVLTIHQAGFRKSNSCETALQSVIVKWKNAIGNKQYVGAVFLDLRRAFETVDKKLLLLKLKRMGLDGVVYKWFNSYLKERYQVVRYGNHMSNKRAVESGVPQGSVLGPILFILYINDIVKVIKKCSIQMFADDTLIYFMADDIVEVYNTINMELQNISRWLNENNLKLNLEKTKYMIVNNRYNVPNDDNFNISVDGYNIEKVSKYKYLGIIIDHNLSFNDHADYVLKKLAKKVYFFSRIGTYLSTETKLLIYHTLIAPNFFYCPTILFMLNKTQLCHLQIKQNRALRVILNCNMYTPIKTMLDCLNCLSVNQCIMLNVFLFIYKLVNNLLPKHLLDYCMFVSDIHNYQTRNYQNFYVHVSRTSFTENQLFNRGLKLYNELPQQTKEAHNIKLFKKNCVVYVKAKWPI